MRSSHPTRATKRPLALATAALLATAVLAGCGGSSSVASSGSSEVIAKAENLTGQARTDYLVKEAKAEDGPLRLYTSYSASSLDALVKAFEKQYDIKVSAYRAAPEQVSQRVTQETSANYAKGADVVEARGFELYQLSKQGLIRSFTGDFTEKVPEYARAKDWTGDRLNIIVPCWNTDKVKADEVPTSYEELADPKWKGRLTIEQADNNWFATFIQYLISQGKTQKEAEDYFRAIVANGSVVSGHTKMQELIVAGQSDLGIDCYTYVTEGQKSKGAPTAWEPAIEPAVSQPNGVTIMKSAKNPASAALFYQWILTDGQKVLAETGTTAVTTPVTTKVIPLDIEAYAKDVDKWNTLYDQILKGN